MNAERAWGPNGKVVEGPSEGLCSTVFELPCLPFGIINPDRIEQVRGHVSETRLLLHRLAMSMVTAETAARLAERFRPSQPAPAGRGRT